MAKNFGARKNSKYKVVSSSPSVNKTPRGDSTPDIPYDVQQDLSGADGTSPNVNFNGDPVYLKTSHSTKVTGDKDGSSGGVKSGTVGAQSDPIEASPSVFVNGKAVVRVGDKQYMQGKNTVGKVTSSESGSAAHITDEGKIEGSTAPEPIPMPYTKNKPTNNSKSGSLGSRTGSPVLLASGKLFYTQSDAELIAPIAFGIRRTYISDGRTGMFGRGWQCSYETRLIRSDPHTLSLIFTDNQTFRFTYDERGFIDTDALGAKLTLLSAQTFLLEYFHDAHSELYVNGFLSEIRDRNKNTLNFVRESNGKLVRIVSGSVSLNFEYNVDGLVSRVKDHANRTWNYGYDPFQNLTHLTDPMSGVSHYTNSASKPYLLEKVIDPCGVVILEADYDHAHRVKSYREDGMHYFYEYAPNRVIKTDEYGKKTFYGLDNWGTIRAITYPDGTTTREEYQDNTALIIDQGGNSHKKQFDARHRSTQDNLPDGRVKVFAYKGNNPYPYSIMMDDKVTVHTYDERYNRLSTTYPDGSNESFIYDDRGNGISHTNRAGGTTSYAYNDLGQLIRIRDALGGITQYVYDEIGNNTAIIDPEEHISRFDYNALSRRICITDKALESTHISYDPAGRILGIVDAIGNRTSYEYDENGKLKREITPQGYDRIYKYERGLLSSMIREDGLIYTFEYDLMRRRISQTLGGKTTQYTYDTLGNLLSVADGENTVEYVYDVNANVILERSGSQSVLHAYSSDGTKRFIGYEGEHYTLGRDDNGHLAQIRKGVKTYIMGYGLNGKQTSISYPNAQVTKNVFDPLGRLTERTIGNGSKMAYLYDKSSRIVMKNNTPITYDAGCRVLSAGDESYTYDESGNLLKDESVIDAISGRLLRQGEIEFTYDTLGRLSKKHSPVSQTTYAYDSEGYLIRYVRTSLIDSSFRAPTRNPFPVQPEPFVGSLELRFTYDPLGRRMTKHYKSQNEKYHHRYLYSGDNIVAIYDNDTEELLATILHDETIDTALSISVHPKDPLSTEEYYHYESLDETEQFLFNQSRIKRYYYHRDHQNSIVALSDDDAQIVEYYEYDIYGTITKSEKIAKTLNPYGYTGREIDTDDLYYYRARYYESTIGRFITPDPIGFLSGDTNFYRYVGNDPVNFIDPSGLIANMAGALAQLASINRGHSDGNPFNGIVPDTSVPKTAIPNSTIPQGKTAAQANKPKAAQVSSKTAQTNKGDGVKISGNVPKVVDEKCKDQKWFDPIKEPQLANYTQGGGKAPYWNVFGTVRNGKMHAGVDLLAKPGTNVYACVDCTVNVIDYLKPSHKGGANYGWYIYLKAKCPTFVRSQKKAYSLPHKKQGEMDKEAGFNDSNNAPIYFFYAHLLEIEEEMHKKYKSGIRIEVKAGQIIGKTGTSGYGTSADPHLHFEIRSNDNLSKKIHARVNPGFYVKYKLPEELTQSENANQKEIAKKQQGDPSPKK